MPTWRCEQTLALDERDDLGAVSEIGPLLALIPAPLCPGALELADGCSFVTMNATTSGARRRG